MPKKVNKLKKQMFLPNLAVLTHRLAVEQFPVLAKVDVRQRQPGLLRPQVARAELGAPL